MARDSIVSKGVLGDDILYRLQEHLAFSSAQLIPDIYITELVDCHQPAATMQRTNYGNVPPAHSPPLHHPVPQHVSTVPQLRSPPPPMPQQQQHQSYGNPYQPQAPQPGGNGFGGYGGFMNDPTAQLASQFGQTAVRHGQEYMEQNVRGQFTFEGLC